MTQREREVWQDGRDEAWDALNPRWWNGGYQRPFPAELSRALAWTAYALASRHGRRRVA